jgi:hypothetical protein
MGLEENYGQPQPRVRNLKEEKVWQGMAVERASLSEYGEPFNRVGNQVDDAGTDGEG